MEEKNILQTDTAHLPKNGVSKTIQLSSNSSLMWRVFVPVFFTMLLVCLNAAFFMTDTNDVYLSYSIWVPRIILLLFLVLWVWFVRRTIWRLRRIEVNATHVYASDYWHTLRYLWDDVESISEKKRMGRRIIQIKLRASGKWGNTLSFLPANDFNEWRDQNKNALNFVL